MNNKDILERLLKIKSGEEKLDNLIKDLTKILKTNKSYYTRKKIYKKSQAGQILTYLKNHPMEKVTGTDFMKTHWFSDKPFIGEKASSRLSELKRWGLVEKVGYRKGIMQFSKPARDRALYTITIKGLKFKLQ